MVYAPTPAQRRARTGLLLGVLSVLLVCVALGLFTIALRTTQSNMQQFLYGRCVARQKYDAASVNLSRQASLRYQAFAAQERTNPYIGDDLRKQRVASWETLAAAAQRVVDTAVPDGKGCQAILK